MDSFVFVTAIEGYSSNDSLTTKEEVTEQPTTTTTTTATTTATATTTTQLTTTDSDIVTTNDLPPDEGLGTGALAGIAIACLLLVLCLILLFLYVRGKRERQNETQRSKKYWSKKMWYHQAAIVSPEGVCYTDVVSSETHFQAEKMWMDITRKVRSRTTRMLPTTATPLHQEIITQALPTPLKTPGWTLKKYTGHFMQRTKIMMYKQVEYTRTLMTMTCLEVNVFQIYMMSLVITQFPHHVTRRIIHTCIWVKLVLGVW